MFLKLSLFVALTFIFSPANAQREIVVMSYESRLPVRDVYIKIDTCQALLRTDYRGRAVMPDSFKVAVFSNVNHLRTIVHSNEVKDSVWLLPKASTLDEVVVYGKRGKLAQQFALPKISDPAMKQNKPSNMHFLQSIYKALHPGKRKQKERDRKIL